MAPFRFCRRAAARLALAVLCTAAQPGLALAERLAVLLGVHDYQTQPDLPGAGALAEIGDDLAAAGFATVRIENLSAGRAADRLDGLAPRMRAAEALVIVVNGHAVRTGREAWLLDPRAGAVSAFAIGTVGVPIGPLLDLAGESPGRAILAVADERRRTARGAGVQPFSVPQPLPQGVAVLTGPLVELGAVLDDALGRRGRPLAEAVAAASNVRAVGYLPRGIPFLPGATTGDDGPRADDRPAPIDPLTPRQRLEREEAALDLDADDRRRVQRSLAILGHDPRGIDGVFGPGTRAAIRSWQRAEGRDATGYLTAAQVDRLVSQGTARAAELEAEAERRQAEIDREDRAFWRDMGRGEDATGLRAYLDRYPDGLFADVARDRLREFEDARLSRVPVEERAAWDRAAEADTAAAYRRYLDSYPDGSFAEDARLRLARRQDEAGEDRAALQAAERTVAGNAIVRRLAETRLQDLGHSPGAVDGEFDADTRRALRRFQDARGLEPTGYLDQATMVRLLIGG